MKRLKQLAFGSLLAASTLACEKETDDPTPQVPNSVENPTTTLKLNGIRSINNAVEIKGDTLSFTQNIAKDAVLGVIQADGATSYVEDSPALRTSNDTLYANQDIADGFQTSNFNLTVSNPDSSIQQECTLKEAIEAQVPSVTFPNNLPTTLTSKENKADTTLLNFEAQNVALTNGVNLIGNNEGKFELNYNPTTQQVNLALKNAVDYETEATSYPLNLELIGEDGITKTHQLTINILDVTAQPDWDNASEIADVFGQVTQRQAELLEGETPTGQYLTEETQAFADMKQYIEDEEILININPGVHVEARVRNISSYGTTLSPYELDGVWYVVKVNDYSQVTLDATDKIIGTQAELLNLQNEGVVRVFTSTSHDRLENMIDELHADGIALKTNSETQPIMANHFEKGSNFDTSEIGSFGLAIQADETE